MPGDAATSTATQVAAALHANEHTKEENTTIVIDALHNIVYLKSGKRKAR